MDEARAHPKGWQRPRPLADFSIHAPAWASVGRQLRGGRSSHATTDEVSQALFGRYRTSDVRHAVASGPDHENQVSEPSVREADERPEDAIARREVRLDVGRLALMPRGAVPRAVPALGLLGGSRRSSSRRLGCRAVLASLGPGRDLTANGRVALRQSAHGRMAIACCRQGARSLLWNDECHRLSCSTDRCIQELASFH